MRLRAFGIAAVLIAVAAAPGRGAGDKEVTLTGEVVDLQCYLTKHGGEGRGPDHAGCANACLSRGVSAGFLAEDGTLFVLFDEKMVSPKERIAGLAGKRVTATGTVLERDGVKGLRVVTLKEAAAGGS